MARSTFLAVTGLTGSLIVGFISIFIMYSQGYWGGPYIYILYFTWVINLPFLIAVLVRMTDSSSQIPEQRHLGNQGETTEPDEHTTT